MIPFLAVPMACLVLVLCLLCPNYSYTHECDSSCRCMSMYRSHRSSMLRLRTATMKVSCLNCLRVMVML